MENPKEYEISFILKSDNTAPITRILNGCGLSVVREEPLVKIKLSYPIKKETQAYFGYVIFSGRPETISEASKDLRLDSEVLRFLIVSPPAGKISGPSLRPEIPRRSPGRKVSHDRGRIVSNEALEKKLEEILQ